MGELPQWIERNIHMRGTESVDSEIILDIEEEGE